MTAQDLALPAGATVAGEADVVLATCHLPVEAKEEEIGVGESAEPELIGRAAAEPEDEE